MRLGDREEQLEARLALAGFEPGQGALGDPGCSGELGEGHVPLGSHALEPGTDVGQDVVMSGGASTAPLNHRFPGNSNQELPKRGYPRMVHV